MARVASPLAFEVVSTGRDGASARTLVVIPAYNEQDAIPGVLADLAAHVPDFDVLVVDDGSSDATAEAALRCGAPVARLPFNLGVGGALRTGFRYAVENGYDRVVQFDGDGQHEAAEIATLLTALDGGADLVVGSRFSQTSHAYEVGRIRSGGMRLLRLAVTVLAGQPFTDTSSGFRGFSRPMIEYFARTYPIEYLGDTVEALLLACYAGFCVVEAPVTMRHRETGVPSTRNLRLLYHYVRLLIVLVTSARLHRSGRSYA